MGKKKTAEMKDGEQSTNLGEPTKTLRLDIGCGHNKRLGFVGIDKKKLSGVDIVHDLNKYPYPFKNESVDEVFCSHFIEHVDDMIAFMDELYRIMKPGAKAMIIAPYYANMRCWQDPTHKRAISECSFLYYNKIWRDSQKLEHYDIKSNFDFVYGYAVKPEWANRNEEARNFAIKHYINVVDDIQVTLTKLKPNEPPKEG